MKNGGPVFIVSCVFILFIVAQAAVCIADYWVSFWTSQEELRTHYEKQNSSEIIRKENVENNTTLPQLLNETIAINTEYKNLLSTSTCIYIHGAVVIIIFIVGIIRSVGFYGMAMKASQNIHDKMFNGIINVSKIMKCF